MNDAEATFSTQYLEQLAEQRDPRALMEDGKLRSLASELLNEEKKLSIVGGLLNDYRMRVSTQMRNKIEGKDAGRRVRNSDFGLEAYELETIAVSRAPKKITTAVQLRKMAGELLRRRAVRAEVEAQIQGYLTALDEKIA